MTEKSYTLADFVKGKVPKEEYDKICKKADKLQQETIGGAAEEWGRRKFLGIRLSVADVKKAIYEKDAEYFKEALLSRLKEGAIQANHFNWRCVSERIEDLDNSIVLLFEELPDSHPEGVIGHQINRLLEAKGGE